MTRCDECGTTASIHTGDYCGHPLNTTKGTVIPATLIKGELELVGLDGNAFAVMGAVQKALRKAGNTPEGVSAVLAEMQSGDYNHLLMVAILVSS